MAYQSEGHFTASVIWIIAIDILTVDGNGSSVG